MLLQRTDQARPDASTRVLQPGTGEIRGDVYLPATVETVKYFPFLE